MGLAEDLAQDALVAALETWPESGIPDNPGAWLMATAKHRAIDVLRRGATLERKQQELVRELEVALATETRPLEVDDVADDLLRLVFTCCHPVLSTEARIALTLRLLGGLTTPEIARAFLVSEATVAQRIVRAKRTLAEAHVPFEVPSGDELAPRLSSVLEVIYLVFNEGYSATAGDDWTRPALCDEALRLGRVLAELAPREPEVHGLVALMEIQASRMRARTGPRGKPVLLLDQDRARWDQLLIRRGLAALERAEELGGASARTRCRPRSPPATRGRSPPRRPTGSGSPRSTTRWPSSRRRRWWSSTARSRWRWRSGRRPGSRSSTRSRRADAPGLPPAPERARRPARQARPHRRGAGRARDAAELTRNERERAMLLERAAALVA